MTVPKSSIYKKGAALNKQLLLKSNSSVNNFTLNRFVLPKSSWSEKLPVIKNYLSQKEAAWWTFCFEKEASLKK